MVERHPTDGRRHAYRLGDSFLAAAACGRPRQDRLGGPGGGPSRRRDAVAEPMAPAPRREPPPFDLAAQLEALAGSLPAELPGRRAWVWRIRSLGGGGLDAVEVEAILARFDRELLDEQFCRPENRTLLETGLDRKIDTGLAFLARRLPKEELEKERGRLVWRLVRRLLGLPVLSLLSPEADPGVGPVPGRRPE